MESKLNTDSLSFWQKLLISGAFLFVLALFTIGVIRWTCFTFVDNYEIAYKYSYWGGGIERVQGNGLNNTGGGYIFAPF